MQVGFVLADGQVAFPDGTGHVDDVRGQLFLQIPVANSAGVPLLIEVVVGILGRDDLEDGEEVFDVIGLG